MQDKFIEGFVSNCIKNGYKTPEEICKCAEVAIRSINKELSKAGQLRARRNKLKALVKGLGPRKIRRKNELKMIDPSLPDEYLVGFLREVCIKICDYIEKNKKVTPTNIMDNVLSIEQNTEVYGAITYLTDRGIIKREGPDRVIVAGDNWDTRPKEKSNDKESVKA